MTLSQLRYFVEVCRWGNNITRAGEELHISQPSISNAIKDLEQEFGVLLFKRANGRLHITADGERFLLKAHELLQKADEMALTMWGAGNRKLVIGLTPMIGAFIFPGLCQGFLALYPDTEFEVHEHGAIETHELLRRKEIDVALNINAAADTTSFHAKHMMLSQYCLCVHRDHPMAGRPSVTVEELTGIGLALLARSTYHTEVILNRFSSQNLQPNVLVRTNQLQTIIQIVRSGIAGSFLLEEAQNVFPDIAAIPFQKPLPGDICMFWNKDTPFSQRAGEFIRFVRGCFPS